MPGRASITIGLSFVALFAATAVAQSPRVSTAFTSIERTIRIDGVIAPAPGGPQRTRETVTFTIYDSEDGGAALWSEAHAVDVDAVGRYAVLLGSSSVEGLPLEVFATGEPRWLGIEVQGAERPVQRRALLTGVPYALKSAKAADADTLGGLPASAFLRAGATRGNEQAGGATVAGQSPDGPTPLTAGIIGHIGKFVTGIDLGNSAMFESAGKIGIGTTTPRDVLDARFSDLNGTMTGIAVQNLGSSATSYSGMLFYDHTGALGQFQGFNNSTKEYRINNVAPGGTINFMTGSVPRFTVASNGFIGIGTASPADRLHVAADIRVGSGTTGCVKDADATVIAGTCSSDLRFKKDITAFAPLLDRFSRLTPVNYYWRAGEFPAKHFGTKRTWGLVAQDVQAVFPDLVTTDEDGYLAVNYSKIPLLTVQAVKELKAENDALRAKNDALEARLAAIEAQLKGLVRP